MDTYRLQVFSTAGHLLVAHSRGLAARPASELKLPHALFTAAEEKGRRLKSLRVGRSGLTMVFKRYFDTIVVALTLKAEVLPDASAEALLDLTVAAMGVCVGRTTLADAEAEPNELAALLRSVTGMLDALYADPNAHATLYFGARAGVVIPHVSHLRGKLDALARTLEVPYICLRVGGAEAVSTAAWNGLDAEERVVFQAILNAADTATDVEAVVYPAASRISEDVSTPWRLLSVSMLIGVEVVVLAQGPPALFTLESQAALLWQTEADLAKLNACLAPAARSLPEEVELDPGVMAFVLLDLHLDRMFSCFLLDLGATFPLPEDDLATREQRLRSMMAFVKTAKPLLDPDADALGVEGGGGEGTSTGTVGGGGGGVGTGGGLVGDLYGTGTGGALGAAAATARAGGGRPTEGAQVMVNEVYTTASDGTFVARQHDGFQFFALLSSAVPHYALEGLAEETMETITKAVS